MSCRLWGRTESDTTEATWQQQQQSLSRGRLFHDPTDYSPPGSCPWDFLGKNIAVSFHLLLQGVFQTQGSNPGLLLAGGFFTISATWEAQFNKWHIPTYFLLKFLDCQESENIP